MSVTETVARIQHKGTYKSYMALETIKTLSNYSKMSRYWCYYNLSTQNHNNFPSCSLQLPRPIPMHTSS